MDHGIRDALQGAKGPLYIATPYASRLDELATATFHAAPECNTVGAALTGGHPLSAAFQAIRDGHADTVIILENDLYRRAHAAEVDAFLKAAAHVIVLDQLANPTTEKAELVLPAGTFAESDGTFVSNEGRAQRFFQVFVPQNDVSASWRWLRLDHWHALDDVVAAMCRALPELAVARDAAPSAAFRIAGAKIPRSPHRESGRTAVLVNIDVSEPKPPDDPDSPLSFSMEGTLDKPPGALIPFFWSPGWNSIQATNTYQKEVGGPLRGGDAGVRILEPAPANGQSYFSTIPPAFRARESEWLLVPMYHIFGSDELSLSAPGIAELVGKPHIAVNTADFTDGAELEVSCAGGTFRLPMRMRPDLPLGLAAVSAGVPPFVGITLPAWGRIARPK
jgi:NADH-quinone oxidoreductase subunit G